MTITTQSEIEAIISQQDFSIRQEVYESNCISLFANNRNIIIDLPIEENHVDNPSHTCPFLFRVLSYSFFVRFD